METGRLHLRPFIAGDAVAIHRVYSDPEVMRYVAGGRAADLTIGPAWCQEHLLYRQVVASRDRG